MKKLIATISVGEEFDAMSRISHSFIKSYAARVGADFFVLCSPVESSTWPGFNKFELGALLKSYDRMLYLDTDILIAPWADDLFEKIPEHNFAATYIHNNDPDSSPAISKGWIKGDIELVQQIFGDIPWNGEYFNSGVMHFNSGHQELFQRGLEMSETWWSNKQRIFSDQTIFNYLVAESGMKTMDLGHVYNHTPAFNHIAHRYESQLIHYVRLRNHKRGTRLRNMKRDAMVIKRKWLAELLNRQKGLRSLVDKL